ncbi:MAG: isoprenyl transferase [Desulforudis sp.]|nr:isoprenyl transferase [Clostridia bacterium]MDQ7791137.1 isoprenyl transferase [Clostridia bacterium]RJX17820.1 MAG: isoprenyl transferase [Desulforudis sp.]
MFNRKPHRNKRAVEEPQIDKSRLPVHVAIIMDGNGRWAKQRGVPKVMGHRAGAESLRDVVRYCAETGILILTAYAFSTENWKRPQDEVSNLMGLLVEYLSKEIQELNDNGVRIKSIGQVDGLPSDAYEALMAAEDKTKENKRLTLNLALNYGGRLEILEAVRKLAHEAHEGRLDPASIDESLFASALYTAGIPDPDLLIRPAGEFRLSNFLLWQIAYTELWITPVLWPDFRRSHLEQAIVDYQCRERRFGGRKS